MLEGIARRRKRRLWALNEAARGAVFFVSLPPCVPPGGDGSGIAPCALPLRLTGDTLRHG